MSVSTVGIALVLACAVFAVLGIWYSRRHMGNLEDYITARGSLGTAGGASTIVATALGAWILFGPAEAATWGGIANVIGYAVGAGGVCFVFIPLGRRMREVMPRGHSLTEFLWHRFGSTIYVVVLIAMLFYMFIFLTAELTAMAGHRRADRRHSALGDGVRGDGGDARLHALWRPARLDLHRRGPARDHPARAARPHGGRLDRGGRGLGRQRRPCRTRPAACRPDLLGRGAGRAHPDARGDPRQPVPPGLLAEDLRRARRRDHAQELHYRGHRRRLAVFAMGLFGLAYVGMGKEGAASTAVFAVLFEALPPWLMLVVMVAGLALVMSSSDTIINGISSIIVVDLGRAMPALGSEQLLRIARWSMLAVSVPIVAVASQGFSVLYLFLIADLICAAIAFPVFFGLYHSRYDGKGAAISIIAGLIAGGWVFPDPTLATGSLLGAFSLAFCVPMLISLPSSPCAGDPEFEFALLRSKVNTIEAG